MPQWLFVFLCLSVPAGWGVTMYFAFGAWERRRRPDEVDEDGLPPIDYSI